MVNNSSKINKIKDPLSSQIVELQKKDHSINLTLYTYIKENGSFA
jgi:DNA-directed RNA polymerase subunit L